MGGQAKTVRPPAPSRGTSQALKPWTRPPVTPTTTPASTQQQPAYLQPPPGEGQQQAKADQPKPTLSDYAAILANVPPKPKEDEDQKPGDKDAKQAAGNGPSGPQEGKDTPQAGDDKVEGKGKGKGKAGKQKAAKSDDHGKPHHDGQGTDQAIPVPQIDNGGAALKQSPLLVVVPSESFKPARFPRSRVETKTGKSGSSEQDLAAALAVFREAMDQSARFHAVFMGLARQAEDEAQASQGREANLARSDLDRGLATLRDGLGDAVMLLDRRADQADARIEIRRIQTFGAITAAANSALGTLSAQKKTADKARSTHEREKDAVYKDADSQKSGVLEQGRNAVAAITTLDTNKATAFPTNADDAMAGAINEAVGLRLDERSEESKKGYTEEIAAQDAAMSKAFDDLKASVEKQFAALGKAIDETAKSASQSIVRARDAAREQLTGSAADLHRAVGQSRARGKSTLIMQHNSLRRGLIASHQDRAMRASLQNQQRATRGTGAAIAAAKGLQSGARAMDETLEKETLRPPSDLAKTAQSSARSFQRQNAKSSPEQAQRIQSSIAQGHDEAAVQAQQVTAKLGSSANESGKQIAGAARNSSDALEQQVQTGTRAFDKFAPQIGAALKSTLPSTIKAYQAQTEGTADQPGMGQAVVKAKEGVAATIAGTGGGKGGDSAGGGAGGGEAKGPKEKPVKFAENAAKIAKDPKTDPGIANLQDTAKADIPPRVEHKVGPLYDSLSAFSTPVETVMANLRGLTAGQGRALSASYKSEHGRDLASHLRSELWKTFSADETNEQNIAAALAYLAGNAAEGAAHELKSAVYLWNDTGRAEKVMRSLTPEQVDQLRKDHSATMDDVSKDLEGDEKKVFDSLKEIRSTKNLDDKARADQQLANLKLLGVANAYGLKRDLDVAMETKGEEGGDKATDAVSNAWATAGSDTISGGDGAYESPEKAKARREAVWLATQQGFEAEVTKLPDGTDNVASKDGPKLGAIARYAAAARNYTEFVPDESEAGGHYETVKKGLDPRQARLIDDIAKAGPNSDDAAASTIEFETNRKEGKPREDRLRKALLGDDLLGAREGESDADREKRLADTKDDKGNVIHKGDMTLAIERKKAILEKVAERQAEDEAKQVGGPVKPKSAEQVQENITKKLDTSFSGDPTGAAYTKSMIQSKTLEPDPKAAFDFALAHKERNKETLVATTERMTRKDVLQAVKGWDDGHGGEGQLYKKLGLYKNDGVLEGDARNEVEIAFRGKPKDEKEKALIAIMVVEQQRRDSAATGRTLAAHEYNAMVAKQTKVLGYLGVTRDQIDEKGDIKVDKSGNEVVKVKMNDKGQLELTPKDHDDFESAMRFSHMHAESYKQAVDRIAQGIVMALVVAAAVITTFVTFGGAAAFWGPVLITAAAGFAGMAMTALIRGDRYTSAEIQRDFVMTLVQAATAGVGSALGAGAKGAGAAAKGAASLEKGAETAAKAAGAGEKLVAGAASATAKESMTLGGKALQLGREVVIGGTSSSVNSFAAAAMDPENRRQGKALSKAVDGGVKGFVSGSLGAALNKPMSALGRPLGKIGERIAGNVGGGFVSRLAEARVGQAMGDPHQSWAESIEGAKEGIAQDAIQAFGEHHAEEYAERRAIRRDRAKQAQRAETHTEVADPHATNALKIPGEELPHQTIRRAEGEEPPVSQRKGPHEEPEGETFMRSARSGNDEPPPTRREGAANFDGDKTPPMGTRIKPTEFPEGVNLKPGMLDHEPPILPMTQVRALDPSDPHQARQNYEIMRSRQPGMEVLLAHNPTTNEYVVVQGFHDKVKPMGEGWVTLRHTHPELTTTNQFEIFAAILPSGIGGDLSVLHTELKGLSAKSPNEPITHSSAIDITVNGQRVETVFSITKHGEEYAIAVTLKPAQQGVSEVKVKSNSPENVLKEYAYKARDLTGGGSDFGLGHNPKQKENMMSALAEAGVENRVVRGARLDETEAHLARVAAGIKPEPQGEAGHAISKLVAADDPHAAVKALGLVGQPDSLAKLTRLLNSDDHSFTPEMRAAVAKVTLEATRAELVRSGGLHDGDDLLMLFRGVTGARTDDYHAEGMDLAKLGPGRDEDAGRGLYGSQDFQSALNYAGSDGQGVVLPLIVRKSELGNVVDVRSGTPLGDRWLAYVRANQSEGRVMPGYPHLAGVLHPGLDLPIGLGRGGRGARFEDFLKLVAADPTLSPAIRQAAADPHITLMDLGGVASWGNDRGMLTDQFAMHHQHIADLFNEAHGFPKSGQGGGGEEPAMMRSALGGDGDGDFKPSINKQTANSETDPLLASKPESGSGTPLSDPSKSNLAVDGTIKTPDETAKLAGQTLNGAAVEETRPAITPKTAPETATPHLVAESTNAHGGENGEKAFVDAAMEANAELHAPKQANTYKEAMDGAAPAQTKAWRDKALADFAMAHPQEFIELKALMGNDIAAVRGAIFTPNGGGRERQILFLMARMISNGASPLVALQQARKVIGLASDIHHRLALSLRHVVELEIWESRIKGLPDDVRRMAESSNLLLYLGAHHPTLLTTMHTDFHQQKNLNPAHVSPAHFEEFVARQLTNHPAVQAETTGRRIVRFTSEADFNEGAKTATPFTRYEFERLAYTTDQLGRTQFSEGVPVRVKGHRSSSATQTAIGNTGKATDVGFHLIAHIFGAVVNELTVVPGNGKRIPNDPDPNLNGSAYKVEFENKVRKILDETDHIVEVQIENIYNSGNATNRPDVFLVKFRTDAGKWEVVPFINKF